MRVLDRQLVGANSRHGARVQLSEFVELLALGLHLDDKVVVYKAEFVVVFFFYAVLLLLLLE